MTLIESREYQQRIVQKAIQKFDDGMRSVLVESPTGSGKSIMALLIAQKMHEKGLRIGWVAMRRHLLAQIERENAQKNVNVPLRYISMFDKSPPSDLDMLIVDEAQHDSTGSMAHIHGTIKPKFILGLSATPFRVDRVKLCFDTVIKDAGIAALIKDGYLSPYYHYALPEWTVETVTSFYVRDQKRWGKSIMYFHRLSHCREAVRILTENGVKCAVIDGNTDTDNVLSDFLDNKLSVLVNCMKLTEGFDAPDLHTVFCRPSCKSVTIQMCGRVLRKHPAYTFKQVVQSINTPYPFQKTALAVLQHQWKDTEWRTVEVNPNIDRINQEMIVRLAKTETKMPEYILKQQAKYTISRRRARRNPS